MATTYSAEIIRKNQKYLLDQVWYNMQGEGCRSKAEAFVKWVDWYIDPRGHPNPYSVIATRVCDGDFMVYTDDFRKYLHSLGLTDDRRIDNYTFKYYDYGWREMSGPTGLVAALLARDGQNLYNSLKKGKNPVAPKKKKTVTKKSEMPFRL